MTQAAPEAGVTTLYEEILAAWNRRGAAGMAGLYAPQGSQVGFEAVPRTGQGRSKLT
jgi:uncharacterized protein (TIGR02246 family)